MKVYYYRFDTIIGTMWMGFTDKGIVKLCLPSEGKEELFNFLNKHFDEIVEHREKGKEYSKEVRDYLGGKLKNFSVPFELYGTEFQKKVWNELFKIPYGETRSYKDIAQNIGNKNASRAVGQANNKNPIPIIIPCHRVVGSNGEMVGYGSGIEFKVKLLQLEGHNIEEKNIKAQKKYYIT